jgi:nitroreductase
LPDDNDRAISLAYDDGRVAERILIAASMLGIGAGIAWIRGDVRQQVAELIGVPGGRFVRTVMSIGHPSAEGRALKSPPGQARLPLDELILP